MPMIIKIICKSRPVVIDHFLDFLAFLKAGFSPPAWLMMALYKSLVTLPT